MSGIRSQLRSLGTGSRRVRGRGQSNQRSSTGLPGRLRGVEGWHRDGQDWRFHGVALWEEQRLDVLASWGRRHREQRGGIGLGSEKMRYFIIGVMGSEQGHQAITKSNHLLVTSRGESGLIAARDARKPHLEATLGAS